MGKKEAPPSTPAKQEESKSKKPSKPKKEKGPGLGERVQSWKEDKRRKWGKFKKNTARAFKVRWMTVTNWFYGRTGRTYVESSYIGKKFLGIIGFFVFYSFAFVLFANEQSNAFMQAIVLGDPYTFGLSLILFFMLFSVLLSIDRLRDFIFEKKTALKQLLVFGGSFFAIFFLVRPYIRQGINFMPFMMILATFWLIFLSVNYFTMARGFSTKVERNFVNKYSKFRLAVASVVPWIIVIALVFVSWIYRYGLVLGTLDILSQGNPRGASSLYGFLTQITIPAIYFTLVITTIFMILEFFITRSKSETRSAGVFDNLTFSLIVLFLSGYLILQLTLYTIVNPSNSGAFQGVASESADQFSLILIGIEFGLSMYFLFRGVRGMTNRFGGKLLFFKKDGLVLVLLACVLSQSVTRFLVLSDTVGDLGSFSNFLSANRLIISVLLIVFLGATVVFYYLSPQQSSMFMRIEKEAVEEEDRVQSLVLKFLRREFIRKGKKFPVDSVMDRLLEITKLPAGVVHSLVHRIADSYVDIILEIVKLPDGNTEKWIDFIPVTERYDSDKGSEDRAKKYLTQAFTQTIQEKKQEKTRISIGRKRKPTRDSAMGTLITSLESSYRKKRQVETERLTKKEQITAKVEDLTKVDLAEDTVDLLGEILRNEFIKRVKKPDQYARVSFRILEVVKQIENLTRLSPADVFPALDVIKARDKNLRLKSYDQDRDRLIDFYPISDLEVSELLELYRPQQFKKLQKILWLLMIDSLRSKHRTVLEHVPLIMDAEASDTTIVIKELLIQMAKHYPEAEKLRTRTKVDMEKLLKIIDLLDQSKKAGKKFDIVSNQVVSDTPQK